MGIERTHGRNYDLMALLNAINLGQVALPEFQREYLWDTLAVKQLVATCINGWPFGSLLLLPGQSQMFFRLRPIEGAPNVKEAVQYVVLDGQQRLTSLYQALFGTGPFRYAINLELLAVHQTIEELEEAVVAVPVRRWESRYSEPSDQFAAGLLPVSVLRQASDFYEWRDAAVESRSERSRLSDLFVRHLSGFDRYQVPAVVIDENVPAEAVARIFERVNRLGSPLGTFDLMVAKSFAGDFNLRDRWEAAQLEFPAVATFLKGDGLPVLSVICLRVSESVRAQDVLALTGAVVRDYWDRAVVALASAIELMSERLAIWSSDWLPYRSQLIVLAATHLSESTNIQDPVLKRWFWKSTFAARYDVASNTRAVEDYRALVRGDDPSQGGLIVERETMLAINRRQYGSIHRGIICLLAASNPKDPIDGTRLTPLTGASPLPIGNPLGKSDRPNDPSLALVLVLPSHARTHDHVAWADAKPNALISQFVPVEDIEVDDEFLYERLQALMRRLGAVGHLGEVSIVDLADADIG